MAKLAPAPIRDLLTIASGTIAQTWEKWFSRLTNETNKKPYLVRSTDADVTLEAENDCVLRVDCSLGNRAIGLPSYTTVVIGQPFCIKKTDATANTATITDSGGRTIDGSPSKILTAQNETAWIIPDGTNWTIV